MVNRQTNQEFKVQMIEKGILLHQSTIDCSLTPLQQHFFDTLSKGIFPFYDTIFFFWFFIMQTLLAQDSNVNIKSCLMKVRCHPILLKSGMTNDVLKKKGEYPQWFSSLLSEKEGNYLEKKK